MLKILSNHLVNEGIERELFQEKLDSHPLHKINYVNREVEAMKNQSLAVIGDLKNHQNIAELDLMLSIQDSYTTDVKHYAKFLAENKLWHSPKSIEAYLADMAKKGTPANTYNKRLSMLKKRCRQILEVNGLDEEYRRKLEAFLGRMKPAKIASKKIDETKILTEEEFEKLLAYPELPEQIRLIARFLWKAGTRISETLDIRLRDIKVVENRVHIRLMGKGRKERTVRISRVFYDKLLEYFPGKEFLFEKPDGRKFRREYVSMRLLLDARKVLGRDISSHTMRHSFGTWTYKKTRKVQAVANYMGHSSSSTTLDMYVHESLDDEDLELDK